MCKLISFFHWSELNVLRALAPSGGEWDKTVKFNGQKQSEHEVLETSNRMWNQQKRTTLTRHTRKVLTRPLKKAPAQSIGVKSKMSAEGKNARVEKMWLWLWGKCHRRQANFASCWTTGSRSGSQWAEKATAPGSLRGSCTGGGWCTSTARLWAALKKPQLGFMGAPCLT